MTYEPPVYPTSIPSQTGATPDLPDRLDDIDWLTAARYNELKKELCAVMTELGTLPKGSSADVKTRLDEIGISVPQDLRTSASPTFAGLNLGAGETTLTNYKVGTWTPKLYAGGNEITSYYYQNGFYTRIGNRVFFHAQLTINNKGAVTGALSIQNLPYTSNAATRNRSVCVLGGSYIMGLTGQHLYGYISEGTTWIDLMYMNGANGAGLDQTHLQTADTTFFVSGSYII